MTQSGWRKSTRSNQKDQCVEVAVGRERTLVRDSKDRHGPILSLDAPRWRAFLHRLREGRFG